MRRQQQQQQQQQQRGLALADGAPAAAVQAAQGDVVAAGMGGEVAMETSVSVADPSVATNEFKRTKRAEDATAPGSGPCNRVSVTLVNSNSDSDVYSGVMLEPASGSGSGLCCGTAVEAGSGSGSGCGPCSGVAASGSGSGFFSATDEWDDVGLVGEAKEAAAGSGPGPGCCAVQTACPPAAASSSSSSSSSSRVYLEARVLAGLGLGLPGWRGGRRAAARV